MCVCGGWGNSARGDFGPEWLFQYFSKPETSGLFQKFIWKNFMRSVSVNHYNHFSTGSFFQNMDNPFLGENVINLPSKSHSHSFYTYEVMRRGGECMHHHPPPPPSHEQMWSLDSRKTKFTVNQLHCFLNIWHSDCIFMLLNRKKIKDC